MGPIHGAIVNWCGHRYGYKNFDNGDQSRNTLILDFLTVGELFQNNHHKFGQSPNFAVRWFEIDPTYQVMRVLAWLGIIDFGAQMLSIDATTGAHAPAAGTLDVPGGFVDPGETLEAAVARELEEELGLRIEPQALRYLFTLPNLYPYADVTYATSDTFFRVDLATRPELVARSVVPSETTSRVRKSRSRAAL